MTDFKEDLQTCKLRAMASALGCGICKAGIRPRPAGDPFSRGPYAGRYWCMDCWTLYWDEHPEHLSDDSSRAYVKEDAKRIRLRRGSELVYEAGDDRVYKTSKGTLVFDLRTSKELAPNEYDPARLKVLLSALKSLEEKHPALVGVAG